MIIHHDDDAYKTVVNSTTCQYHRQYPGKAYAGCTCSSSIGSVRRAPEEIALIKRQRKLAQEDSILAQADAIRAGRGEI